LYAELPRDFVSILFQFVLYLVFVMLAALISGFIVDYVFRVGINP
jgi:hypothetical protein